MGLICAIIFGSAFAAPSTAETTEHIIVEYFWHLLSLGVSPLVGFTAGQFYKMSLEVKPHPLRTALVSGGFTAFFAFMLWPGTWSESGKIAATVGTIQPFIVWGWFVVATRFAPKQAESLKGNNGNLTVLPWIKMKQKPKEFFDVTGGK